MACAQIKYGVPQCLGVATEPIGGGVRSYDFAMAREFPPADVIERLKGRDDPFSSEKPLSA
jgi:hypothetical protein